MMENFKNTFGSRKGKEQVKNEKKQILAEFEKILDKLRDAIDSVPIQ